MRTQPALEHHRAFALTLVPEPLSPWRAVSVEAQNGYKLKVRFRDGVEGIVEMSRLVHGADAGVFAALTDPVYFSRAQIVHGAVAWPGGPDLAPDAMHDAIKANGRWVL